MIDSWMVVAAGEPRIEAEHRQRREDDTVAMTVIANTARNARTGDGPR